MAGLTRDLVLKLKKEKRFKRILYDFNLKIETILKSKYRFKPNEHVHGTD